MVPSVESGCRGGRKHPLPRQARPGWAGSISYINSVRATFSVSCVRDDLWRGCLVLGLAPLLTFTQHPRIVLFVQYVILNIRGRLFIMVHIFETPSLHFCDI